MNDPFGNNNLTNAEQLALDQASADIEMLSSLVSIRRQSGLTQTEVAEEMGRDKSAVCRFERLDSDPRLSTVRRYAGAIGVLITHNIERVTIPKTDDLWQKFSSSWDITIPANVVTVGIKHKTAIAEFRTTRPIGK